MTRDVTCRPLPLNPMISYYYQSHRRESCKSVIDQSSRKEINFYGLFLLPSYDILSVFGVTSDFYSNGNNSIKWQHFPAFMFQTQLVFLHFDLILSCSNQKNKKTPKKLTVKNNITWTHQCVTRQNLQQSDQVMSISQVFVQVIYVLPYLQIEENKNRIKVMHVIKTSTDSKFSYQGQQFFYHISYSHLYVWKGTGV